uniref:Nucleoporin Nup159/Nup146 N-terminal domain-containing protein n=1 Tax=Rhodosorus marinus TaxID=101924 RepID=A0A7S2ZZ04_9RHOD|mmetsp:Transcript_34406/g.135272  ORF Transcript_34406/g.135272 Transcript_34406/m.135272 type:complete len:2035 (+) Transcript_34406:190-6294(+)
MEDLEVEEPRDVDFYRFVPDGRLRLVDLTEADNIAGPKRLLEVSSKYGLVAAGGRMELCFMLLSSFREESLKYRSASAVRENPLPNPPAGTIRRQPTTGQPCFLKLSPDERTLLVLCSSQIGAKFPVADEITLYDISELLMGVNDPGSEAKPLYRSSLDASQGFRMVEMCERNDGRYDIIALSSSGDVKRLSLPSMETESMLYESGNDAATSMAVTRRGTVACIGTSSGEIKIVDVFKGESIASIPSIESEWSVQAINEIGENSVLASYGRDVDLNHVVYKLERSGEVVSTVLGELCFGIGDPSVEEGGSPDVFVSKVPAWSVFAIATSVSSEIELVVLDSERRHWVNYKLNDDATATLPMNGDDDDTFPIGIALDMANTSTVPSKDTSEDDINAMPRMYVLNNEGLVLKYVLADDREGAKCDAIRESVPPPPLPNPIQSSIGREPAKDPSKPAPFEQEPRESPSRMFNFGAGEAGSPAAGPKGLQVFGSTPARYSFGQPSTETKPSVASAQKGDSGGVRFDLGRAEPEGESSDDDDIGTDGTESGFASVGGGSKKSTPGQDGSFSFTLGSDLSPALKQAFSPGSPKSFKLQPTSAAGSRSSTTPPSSPGKNEPVSQGFASSPAEGGPPKFGLFQTSPAGFDLAGASGIPQEMSTAKSGGFTSISVENVPARSGSFQKGTGSAQQAPGVKSSMFSARPVEKPPIGNGLFETSPVGSDQRGPQKPKVKSELPPFANDRKPQFTVDQAFGNDRARQYKDAGGEIGLMMGMIEEVEEDLKAMEKLVRDSNEVLAAAVADSRPDLKATKECTQRLQDAYRTLSIAELKARNGLKEAIAGLVDVDRKVAEGKFWLASLDGDGANRPLSDEASKLDANLRELDKDVRHTMADVDDLFERLRIEKLERSSESNGWDSARRLQMMFSTLSLHGLRLRAIEALQSSLTEEVNAQIEAVEDESVNILADKFGLSEISPRNGRLMESDRKPALAKTDVSFERGSSIQFSEEFRQALSSAGMRCGRESVTMTGNLPTDETALDPDLVRNPQREISADEQVEDEPRRTQTVHSSARFGGESAYLRSQFQSPKPEAAAEEVVVGGKVLEEVEELTEAAAVDDDEEEIEELNIPDPRKGGGLPIGMDPIRLMSMMGGMGGMFPFGNVRVVRPDAAVGGFAAGNSKAAGAGAGASADNTASVFGARPYIPPGETSKKQHADGAAFVPASFGATNETQISNQDAAEEVKSEPKPKWSFENPNMAFGKSPEGKDAKSPVDPVKAKWSFPDPPTGFTADSKGKGLDPKEDVKGGWGLPKAVGQNANESEGEVPAAKWDFGAAASFGQSAADSAQTTKKWSFPYTASDGEEKSSFSLSASMDTLGKKSSKETGVFARDGDLPDPKSTSSSAELSSGVQMRGPLPPLGSDKDAAKASLPPWGSEKEAPKASLPPLGSEKEAPKASLPPMGSEKDTPKASLPPMGSEKDAPKASLPPLGSEKDAPKASLPPLGSEKDTPKALKSSNGSVADKSKGSLPPLGSEKDKPKASLPPLGSEKDKPKAALPPADSIKDKPKASLPAFGSEKDQPKPTSTLFGAATEKQASTPLFGAAKESQPVSTGSQALFPSGTTSDSSKPSLFATTGASGTPEQPKTSLFGSASSGQGGNTAVQSSATFGTSTFGGQATPSASPQQTAHSLFAQASDSSPAVPSTADPVNTSPFGSLAAGGSHSSSSPSVIKFTAPAPTKSLFGSSTTTDESSGPFGSKPAQGQLFGTGTVAEGSSGQSSSAFGMGSMGTSLSLGDSKPDAGTSFGFGSSSFQDPPETKSPFGAAPQTENVGGFGQSSSTAIGKPSPFGTATQSAQSGSGIFGSSPSQPAAGGFGTSMTGFGSTGFGSSSGGFGNQSSSQASTFGGQSGFGSPSAAQSSAFGQQSSLGASASPFGAGGFGQPASIGFGGGQASSGSAFQTPTVTSGFGAGGFGSSAGGGGGGFAALASQAQSTSGFGTNSQQTGFGTNPQQPSGFGGGSQQQGGFGSTNNNSFSTSPSFGSSSFAERRM